MLSHDSGMLSRDSWMLSRDSGRSPPGRGPRRQPRTEWKTNLTKAAVDQAFGGGNIYGHICVF